MSSTRALQHQPTGVAEGDFLLPSARHGEPQLAADMQPIRGLTKRLTSVASAALLTAPPILVDAANQLCCFPFRVIS